ncbi:MAG: VOC family protein [Flavobacteriaceae bacterium]
MKLNQVTVPAMDVERAISFYEILGLKLIVKALPHYARFEMPEGEATFSVHLVDELPKGEGVYIYFESERLDAWVEELKGRGINFDELPEDRRWLWREARLRDPDGNRLILYYAGENRKNPPWRLGHNIEE